MLALYNAHAYNANALITEIHAQILNPANEFICLLPLG